MSALLSHFTGATEEHSYIFIHVGGLALLRMVAFSESASAVLGPEQCPLA